MRRLMLGLVVVFLLAGVLSTAAQDAPPQPTAISTPDVVATAQALVERAEAIQDQTLNTINSFMGLIQVAGVILAFITAVVGIFGFFGGRKVVVDMFDARKLLNETIENRKEYEVKQKEIITQFKEIDNLQTNLITQVKNVSEAISLTQLGLRQADMGNYVVASEIFREANKINPNNPVIRYFTGDLYLRIGNIREGKRNLKFAIENGDSPSAKASYAYALRLEGDQDELGRNQRYQQAEKYFLEVYQQDRDLLDISGESAFGALAGLYKRQGNYKDAMKYYKHCASITPRSSYAVNNLGLLYYRWGEEIEANSEQARKKAQDCFKQSKENALYAVKLSSADYWRFFDLITACTALDESFEDVIEGHITQAFNRKPLDTDVDKLLGGLEELEKAPNPPKDIERVITDVKARAGIK